MVQQKTPENVHVYVRVVTLVRDQLRCYWYIVPTCCRKKPSKSLIHLHFRSLLDHLLYCLSLYNLYFLTNIFLLPLPPPTLLPVPLSYCHSLFDHLSETMASSTTYLPPSLHLLLLVCQLLLPHGVPKGAI